MKTKPSVVDVSEDGVMIRFADVFHLEHVIPYVGASLHQDGPHSYQKIPEANELVWFVGHQNHNIQVTAEVYEEIKAIMGV